MRKVAAAALAVPVLAILYLPVLARRSIAARVVLLGTVGVVVLVAAVGLAEPVPTTATPPAPPITALADAAFRSITAGTDLRAGVRIQFSEPMDPQSVAASLSVEPAAAVHLDWASDRRTLTVRPARVWPAGTYEVITVEPGALAASGRPMSTVARAAFVTRAATTGRIRATRLSGERLSPASAFQVAFDRSVALSDVTAAFRITPPVAGSVTLAAGRPDPAALSGTVFVFTPSAALTADTKYQVTVEGVVDVDGAPVQDVPALKATTTEAPAVVRFRPAKASSKVDRKTNLSVRFSTAMSHATTRAALRVTAAGKVVRGTIRFAESDTVLVFDPSSALPASAAVAIQVGAGATSSLGVPLAAAAKATIHTAAAPKRKVASKPRVTTTHHTTRSSPPPSRSSGGAVGGGSWGAVESYYLHLMNCTRTGGWVTSNGACSSPGGRHVAALRLDSGISSKVSRPYAKRLAIANACTHFIGGNPGTRLRAAGYRSYRWAENIGCRSGGAYSSVLGSHLFFQAERSSNGGHWVNMMNAAYDRVGIGVWVASGRVRLVIDFYHPL